MWKRKLGKDFYSCLCSTETPFSFKFTMSCFDINLLTKSVIYFTVQGWIIWQNKTHTESHRFLFPLGFLKCSAQPQVFDVHCSKQCHSAGRTHRALPITTTMATCPGLDKHLHIPSPACWDLQMGHLSKCFTEIPPWSSNFLFGWFFLSIPVAINQPHISLVFLSCHWQFPRDWSLPPLLFDEGPLC